MNSASRSEATQPPSELESGRQAFGKGRVLAWAAWDWGSAAFNAVMTTFVFTVYLTSSAFGGEDQASAVLGGALAIAGARHRPARSGDGPALGHRRAGASSGWESTRPPSRILTALCFFVFPRPEFLLLGVALIALGNVFFEFAGVNYNAMLAQVSTPANIGKVSGFGWGMGYLGGIVALLIVLQLFVQPQLRLVRRLHPGQPQHPARGRVLRAVVLHLRPPGDVRRTGAAQGPSGPRASGFLASYGLLARRIKAIYRTSPHTIFFLLASAIFRDGLAAVFTFGGIIAAGTFGFELPQVIFFAIFGNIVAAAGAVLGGFLDDRVGPKAVIIGSWRVCWSPAPSILALGNGNYSFFGMDWAGSTTFWVFGLFLCLFVGPAQSSSRAYLARLAPQRRVRRALRPLRYHRPGRQLPRPRPVHAVHHRRDTPGGPRRSAALGHPGHHGGPARRAAGPAAGEGPERSRDRGRPAVLAGRSANGHVRPGRAHSFSRNRAFAD